jgi:hypothetical protein
VAPRIAGVICGEIRIYWKWSYDTHGINGVQPVVKTSLKRMDIYGEICGVCAV